jgi:hypothetical protein
MAVNVTLEKCPPLLDPAFDVDTTPKYPLEGVARCRKRCCCDVRNPLQASQRREAGVTSLSAIQGAGFKRDDHCMGCGR